MAPACDQKMFLGLGREFDKQTAYASILSGFFFAAGLWLTITAYSTKNLDSDGKAVYYAMRAFHCIPLICAFLLVLPLFLINTNVIKREGGYDFDRELYCRRIIFLFLLVLQFAPFSGSLAFLFPSSKEGEELSLDLQVLVVAGSCLCMLGAFILKIGTYKPKEDDGEF